MKIIKFNRLCPGWCKDEGTNALYLYYQRNYIVEKFEHRGYIYLNQVYDTFGVDWNPDDENICYRSDTGGVTIDFEALDNNEFLIKIT